MDVPACWAVGGEDLTPGRPPHEDAPPMSRPARIRVSTRQTVDRRRLPAALRRRGPASRCILGHSRGRETRPAERRRQSADSRGRPSGGPLRSHGPSHSAGQPLRPCEPLLQESHRGRDLRGDSLLRRGRGVATAPRPARVAAAPRGVAPELLDSRPARAAGADGREGAARRRATGRELQLQLRHRGGSRVLHENITPDTRFAVVYNAYLAPIHRLFARLGLRSEAPPTTFLTVASLTAVVELAGFQIIRLRNACYFPWSAWGAGRPPNQSLAMLPFVKWFGLCSVVVLRPRNLENLRPTGRA